MLANRVIRNAHIMRHARKACLPLCWAGAMSSSSMHVRAYATEASGTSASRQLPSNSAVTITKDVTTRLSLSQGPGKETKQFSKKISLKEDIHLVIVKIGGGVLEGEQLKKLVSSVEFLRKEGLYPIMVHGGGPQLNEELDKAGEVPQYENGLRITSPRVLSIAARVFERENTKLVDALEQAGIRARPVHRVFEAQLLDAKTYGLVGDVTRINTDTLASCIIGGYIPVLTSLGQTPEGQLLNINADVAALQLAKEIQPLKVLFVNTTSGILDGDKKLIQHIRLEEEYDHLMTLPWVKHGTRLKIKEIKACLDELPAASSVSLTSPEHVAAELYESRGLGTHVSRGEKIMKYEKIEDVDAEKIRTSLEKNGQSIPSSYLKDISARLKAIYATPSYEAVAVVLKDKKDDVAYMDKFVISQKARAQGISQLLWNRIKKDNPSICWRSRVGDSTNAWYFEQADGSIRNQDEVVFWCGIESKAHAQNIVASYPATPSTTTTTAGKISSAQVNVVAPPAQGYRIGMLGGRGHTGTNLIHLLSQHKHAKLVCATSSTSAGTPVRSVCADAPEGLNFINVTPEAFVKTTQELGIDAWFLALHDKAAKPYVDAIANSANAPVLIDLSADHRFDSTWVYGQPEGGNRDKIRGAKRIANPGCYATGMYLTLAPLVKAGLVDGPAHFFGVSGYSGAGTTPSPKNDKTKLSDNLMPYTLTNHNHEREVSHQLGHPIHFTPHVGQWFQGITLTGQIDLTRTLTSQELEAKYREFFGKEVLVKIAREIPEVKAAAKTHHVNIGGLAVAPDGRRVVTVTTLDNLLKGAATQAIQNLNLALRLEDELDGIRKEL